MHKFGRKYATPQQPKIGRRAKRRALFGAAFVSCICGQVCAKMDFSKTRFLQLESLRAKVTHVTAVVLRPGTNENAPHRLALLPARSQALKSAACVLCPWVLLKLLSWETSRPFHARPQHFQKNRSKRSSWTTVGPPEQ